MKNESAVELGRLGGLKGGHARAEKLSPERRSEIARKAAEARWSNSKLKTKMKTIEIPKHPEDSDIGYELFTFIDTTIAELQNERTRLQSEIEYLKAVKKLLSGSMNG